ncbi:Crp/Fnr family transcriptional regulator [Portibacter marinus]|uniref:Crp/Fnr family transcriptional regulator n=1 Tax=Portibacter marinus TaxID=2898660 RepID=UPI001F2BCB0E|nr:Crp/Fnr family transcriptional regulator [Portibacter marinus]
MNEKEINEFLVKATKIKFEQLKELLVLGKMKSIEKKSLLAEPGKIIDHSYFLIDGIVRHFVVDKRGEEYTKTFMRSPDFVVASIPDFFLRTKDSIHCEALTDLIVIEWTYDQLIAFGKKVPEFFLFLIRCVVKAYKMKEQKEIAMHILDATERYEKFVNDYPEIAYDVPLRYIASYLNIRPETLSRIRAPR